MKINEIKSNTTGDRMILSTENPSQRCEKKNDRYEEFYEAFFHINLNSAKYKSLDRKNIAIINKSTGDGGSASMSSDYGIFYTNHYSLSDSKEVKSLLDLSSTNKFNIYAGFGITKQNKDVWRSFEFIVTNPVGLEYGVSKTIPSANNVFRVAKASDQNKKYVIEITAPGTERIKDIYQNMNMNADARYLDGTRRPYFAPKTNEKSSVATYYLGTIDNDFMFNVCWTGDESATEYGSIKLREITDDELNSIAFISLTSTSFTIPNISDYKLFVVVPEIDVASVEFLGLSGTSGMNLYYMSGHKDGIGYSGRGYNSDVKVEIRSSDILEYFYTRSIEKKTGEVSGTVSITTR